MKNFLLILMIIILLSACALERNNPLDPRNNAEIETPKSVNNLSLSHSPDGAATKYVDITWDYLNGVAGYYIYRGLSWNGVFERIADRTQVSSSSDDLYLKDSDVVADTYYYYKISAYNEQGLEGPLTTSPKYVKVE